MLDEGARLRDDKNSTASVPLPLEDPALLRLLLEHGADASTYQTVERYGKAVRLRGPGGNCLVTAVRAKNVEVVAILLDHGVREPQMLYEAAQAMFEVTQERRLAHEAPPRDRAETILRRRARVLNLLLDGLDPNAPGGTGQLLLAATGDGRSVEILRQRGAKIDAERYLNSMLKNADEETKRQLAALPQSERYAGLYQNATLYNDTAMIQTLRDAVVPMPLSTAALVGNVDRVREILKIDPAMANKYPAGNGGFGPLRMAAACGNFEVCKLLIDAGAEVMRSKIGSQDWGGMTPLEAAAVGGHVDVVKLLLAHGAQVDVHNLTATDSMLIDELKSYVARQEKEDDGRRLIGIIQLLPLLKEAAATQPSAATRPAD